MPSPRLRPSRNLSNGAALFRARAAAAFTKLGRANGKPPLLLRVRPRRLRKCDGKAKAIADTLIGKTLAREIRKIGAASLTPNQSGMDGPEAGGYNICDSALSANRGDAGKALCRPCRSQRNWSTDN